MTKTEALSKMSDLISDNQIAVFAAVHKEGRPHVHWMKPALINSESHAIYTLTPLHYIDDIDFINYPQGEWMIQNRELNEIMNIEGDIDFFSNPTVNNEVMKAMGGHLLYWEDDKTRMERLVMEMQIKKVHYYKPDSEDCQLIEF